MLQLPNSPSIYLYNHLLIDDLMTKWKKWSCQLASRYGQTVQHNTTPPPWLASCETAILYLLAKYLKLYTVCHLHSSITSQTHSCLCSFVQQFLQVFVKKINKFWKTNTVVFVLWQNDWLWNPVAGKNFQLHPKLWHCMSMSF